MKERTPVTQMNAIRDFLRPADVRLLRRQRGWSERRRHLGEEEECRMHEMMEEAVGRWCTVGQLQSKGRQICVIGFEA